MASAKAQRNAVVKNNELFVANSDEGKDLLSTNAGSALTALGDGRTTARSAIDTTGQAALGSLGTGYTQARSDIMAGGNQARSDLTTGIGLFDGFAANGNAANQAQSDFLGLGDGAAADAALARFRGATGYRDIVDQTSDAALRKASVVGGLGGNQLDELGRIGAQLGNQSAQQYFGNLGTVAGQGLTALGQQQQGYNALASQGQQQGAALAGLASQNGAQTAGVYSGMGSSLAGIANQGGAQDASIYTGLGNSLNQLGQYTTSGMTSGIFEAGKAGDAAKAANQNAMIGAAGTGLSLLSGGGGLGGLFGGTGLVSNALGAATNFSPFPRNM